MKSLRVLVLLHPELMPPESRDGFDEKESYVWKTEFDVINTLRGARARGQAARRAAKNWRRSATTIEEWKPDIVFNLLEEFHGETLYAQNVVSLLELLRVPYTGCNPRGLMLARGKDLSKKLLKYHRIPVPAFAVFPMGKTVRRPAGWAFR